MKRLSALAVALLLCAGCATSTMRVYPAREGEKSPAGAEVVKRVDLMSSGVFLFYFIPLWSGNEYHPNRRDYETFENRLQEKYFYRVFDSQCEKGQMVESPQIRFRSSGWWTLGILWKRTMFGSALIVRDARTVAGPEKDEENKE